ncbi:hypothetical protein [Corallococcus sp. EGB]|uniref:hypothetical protein n=1 Tax=Corallococcus sp. EGB TaxID=1521117 RepID=UPI001CBC6FEA|nr:hypothetical protein [Corallococcus sp. EGB]
MEVDGEGNVLLEFANSVTESHRLELLGPSGGLVKTFYDLPRQWRLIAQDQGFHLLGPRSDSDPTRVLHVMTPNGTLIPKPVDLDRVTDVIPRGGQGSLLLRAYRPSEGRWRIDVLTLDREGEQSAAPLFIASGAGPYPPWADVASSQVDSALVLFDSSETHNGSQWSARWFRPGGTAVGPPFVVVEKMPSGSYFRMEPLLNGELGLRSGGAWVGRLTPFHKELRLAPPWLAVQPGFSVSPIRQGRGYGLVRSDSENGCKNFMVVHARSGERCGEVVLPPVEPPCQSSSLRLTRDGTLVQFVSLGGEFGAYSLRWWTGLLK